MTDESTAEVLIVDDEAALAESYAAMIGTEHDVRTATSGAEALETVDDTVDVVLLDRRMPDTPGLAVLAEIHRRDLHPQIVLCSAVDPDLEILEYEFDDYLRKPAGSEELLGAIEQQRQLLDCDPATREYCALASKRAALEDSRPASALEGDQRYESLLETLDEMADHAPAGGESAVCAN